MMKLPAHIDYGQCAGLAMAAYFYAEDVALARQALASAAAATLPSIRAYYRRSACYHAARARKHYAEMVEACQKEPA